MWMKTNHLLSNNGPVRLRDLPSFQHRAKNDVGLIAVNYPARKFGITRFLKLEEAMKLCPNLMCVHVATWRVGADKAVCDYHTQTATSISTDKVSLDHYR